MQFVVNCYNQSFYNEKLFYKNALKNYKYQELSLIYTLSRHKLNSIILTFSAAVVSIQVTRYKNGIFLVCVCVNWSSLDIVKEGNSLKVYL